MQGLPLNVPLPWGRLQVTVPVGVLGAPDAESTTSAAQVSWVLTGPLYVLQASDVVVARVPTGRVVSVVDPAWSVSPG